MNKSTHNHPRAFEGVEVRPLLLGGLTVDKSTLTYLQGFGRPVTVPIIAWLLRDRERTWLVDTGAPPAEAGTDPDMRQRPEDRLLVRLASEGLRPEDIDVVVNTHLHFDHVGGNDLFPHARFVVQRAELAYARAPLPIHVRGYERASAAQGPDLRSDSDWWVVDGDCELSADVRVMLTPGHTPGLQAVVVESPGGRIVIASDNVPLYENWAGTPAAGGRIPSGIHVDLRACYATFDKLERTGGTILPGHDHAVLDDFHDAPQDELNRPRGARGPE